MSKHPAPAHGSAARTAVWLAAIAAAPLCMAPASAREDPGNESAGLVPAALAAPAEMAVGGVALPYMDEGEGRPIVFVHGSISDRRDWEPLREDAAVAFLEAVFRLEPGSGADQPQPWPAIWRDDGRTLPAMMARDPGEALNCEDLAGIDVPTLVLSGAETAPYYAVAAERVADCLANALHVAWEGVNHDGPYRRPDDLARTALDFGAMID